MRERTVILLGLALLLTLGVVCLAVELPRLEAGLEASTTAALLDAGVRNLRVEANGRSVTLLGTIAFGEIGIEAARRAAAAPGVRTVENRLDMAMDPSFEFSPGGDIWLLRGRLPTPESRQELFDAAAAIVGRGNVIDETQVDQAVTEPDWLASLPRLVQLLRQVDGAPGLRLEDGTLTLTGHTSSEAMRDRLILDVGRIREEAAAAWTIAGELRIAPVGVNQVAENRIRRLLADQPITFFGSTDILTADGLAAVNGIGDLLQPFPDTRTEILMDRNSGGDPEADRQLSMQRAEAVRTALSAHVHPNRLLALGYGRDRLDAKGDTGTNQRIEFRVFHRP